MRSAPRRRCRKSTVSRVCQAIAEEFDGLVVSGALDELELDYLFLDASMFKMHPGARAEPVLAAWGITTEGAPVFVGLGGRRSGVHRRLGRLPRRADRPWAAPAAAGHLRRRGRADQRRRDRLRPLAAAALSDPPLPQPAWPRCRPRRSASVRDAYWAIFDTDDLIAAGWRPGRDWSPPAQQRIDAFADTYAGPTRGGGQVPAHRSRPADQLPAFPGRAPPPIRHSNFIERTFGETRRRVKVIGRLPGETSCSPGVGGAGPRLPRLARRTMAVNDTPQRHTDREGRGCLNH